MLKNKRPSHEVRRVWKFHRPAGQTTGRSVGGWVVRPRDWRPMVMAAEAVLIERSQVAANEGLAVAVYIA